MKIRLLLAFAVLAVAALLPARALVKESAPPDDGAARHHLRGHGDVTLFGTNVVAPGQVVTGDAVSILGGVWVDGEVRGSVVAVLGDVTLGPGARVGGDAICIGGHLHRAPGAVVGGEVIVRSIGSGIHVLGPAHRFWLAGYRRPQVWLANLAVLLFYAFIARLVPDGVRQCGQTLLRRPGLSLLAAIFTVLALPCLFVLLIVTIVGIPLAFLVLPAGLVLLWIFGKTSFYALVGAAILGREAPAWTAVLLGGAICLAFFLVPAIGLVISGAISILMMGSVVVTLADSIRNQPSGRPPPSVPPPLL